MFTSTLIDIWKELHIMLHLSVQESRQMCTSPHIYLEDLDNIAICSCKWYGFFRPDTRSMNTDNKSPFLQFTSSASAPTPPSQPRKPIFMSNDELMLELMRGLRVFEGSSLPLSDAQRRNVAAMLALHSYMAKETGSSGLVDTRTNRWLAEELCLPTLTNDEAASALTDLGFAASDTCLEPGRMRTGQCWLKAPYFAWYCDHIQGEYLRDGFEAQYLRETSAHGRCPFRFLASYIAEMTPVPA